MRVALWKKTAPSARRLGPRAAGAHCFLLIFESHLRNESPTSRKEPRIIKKYEQSHDKAHDIFRYFLRFPEHCADVMKLFNYPPSTAPSSQAWGQRVRRGAGARGRADPEGRGSRRILIPPLERTRSRSPPLTPSTLTTSQSTKQYNNKQENEDITFLLEFQ